ncbi:MAG: RNA 2',3'-cyclic phosphodiesterase [Candidatus Pacearchaeota archaeon]|nr:RNA 2',3'-cyclic phosphodiesterase [Candidatus Pacearchaeota archaeon]
MRTFIAIDIPEEIKERIIDIQKKLPEFKGKITEKENLHLTLKFLGEVDEKKLGKIKNKLREIKINSFGTDIDSIGFFDNRRGYRKQLIIWLHMTNCDELQKQIDSKLETLFEKEKRFMAHLTIARIKEIKNDKKFFAELNKIKIPKMNFIIEKFYLKKSVVRRPGPIYENLETYRLKI